MRGKNNYHIIIIIESKGRAAESKGIWKVGELLSSRVGVWVGVTDGHIMTPQLIHINIEHQQHQRGFSVVKELNECVMGRDAALQTEGVNFQRRGENSR